MGVGGVDLLLDDCVRALLLIIARSARLRLEHQRGF